MAWQKSPPALVESFVASLPEDTPAVEQRSMFGYPCAFVGGNMVTGLHDGAELIVRGCADGDAAPELLSDKGESVFHPMPGAP